jgi:serine protease Do
MSLETKPRAGRASRLKGVLLGSVFALALGGIVAGEAVVFSDNTAQAQNLSAQVATPAQPFSFADVVERVQPAVVSIRVKTDESGPQAMNGGRGMPGMPDIPEDSPLYDFFKRFGQPGMPGGPGGQGGEQPHRFGMAQGSGFFISADGYVVTNNHVVENAEEVTVVTTDGRELPADVIGTDPKTDLALVKVKDGKDLPHVTLAKGDTTRVGDWVVAVGNPFGLGGSVTAGIISARGRDIGAGPYDDFLQIDAPINRGNSGGPTFNLAGEVIGVNTAIYSPSGGSVGIGFAIPARTVETVVKDLMDDGKVVRGWIGVQIQPVTEDLAASLGLDEARGALITEPQPNSPAVKAGLEAGDAILAVNGEKIEDARELARTIAGYPPETTVDLEVWRDGKPVDLKVTLGQLPDDQQLAAATPSDKTEPTAMDDLGLKLAPASAVGAGDAGVVVTELDPNGKAAEKGLQQGDVILEVAGQVVSSPADVASTLRTAAAEGRKAVLMRVKSGDNLRFLALPLDKA